MYSENLKSIMFLMCFQKCIMDYVTRVERKYCDILFEAVALRNWISTVSIFSTVSCHSLSSHYKGSGGNSLFVTFSGGTVTLGRVSFIRFNVSTHHVSFLRRHFLLISLLPDPVVKDAEETSIDITVIVCGRIVDVIGFLGISL